MTSALWLTILAIMVLIIVSAFFSGSETALTAASRARMHAFEKAGDERAAIVQRLIQTRERLIGALLLGNNLVNILASALATSLFITLFGDTGVVYATLVMTAVVLVFAEVMPKTLAISNPDRFALTVSPVVRVIVAVFSPVVIAIEAFVKLVLNRFGANIGDQDILSAHEELRGTVDLQHSEGGLVKDDRDRIGGLLDLNELEVSDIMVHRTGMMVLNADESPSALVDMALASPYTRIPIWRGDPDNIVGVLHAKDLLRSLQAQSGNVEKLDITEIATKPWFVPDTTSLKAQLNAFLKRKVHFALVVDEYGEVQGLVTLEDILEEIVGEIADEHDLEIQGVVPQPDGSVNVEGTVPVRDLNRAMDWSLPDEEATTIAGLVIHAVQTIPEPGQAFTFYGFRFRILRRQRNRITSLRITPLSKDAGALKAAS
ncbi:HlyC/CorC family transporter [Pararhizobium sp. IMCC21322]|uniref:HlyC/CorC family transporter n=1 Tax=Pararhizobium sp. IMCC21322 TaxID=3067903 RepID=UPI002741144D|nr:HlyC/CorC family transporter [Pararhizobium sp. IMCC21322]